MKTTAASLESLCELMANNTLEIYDTLDDRTTIIQVARDLATAVTRGVVIVDAIVCDHFLLSKNKVSFQSFNNYYYLSDKYDVQSELTLVCM